ncbi:DUF2231 domain-containing protein [Mycobacterium sp. PSTR-4-N]|uniref:DUF2231 domain-containing protein n=1 Tax=Mycobacterium sp. PSTR-4-N TaxID=2917745 RepID=UPI001F156408|nr:DUF2231 domain-containing protein [Mycobacterium sp. PSTR-4-N]MCG7594356.1 DUF2231 domain-containing protein [Mycobacterium sp. PSTR-4-N]
MNAHEILAGVDRFDSLDGTAGVAADVADRIVTRTGLARLLRGSWLGHPVHPLLVTIPIGPWSASILFDVVFDDPEAARRLLGVGLAAVPPTVLAGWADFPLLNRRQQRVGLVHAGSNAVAVGLFSLAYRAYRREKPAVARRYSILGLLAMGIGGALGGHLSYAQGAGMFRWQSPLQIQRQRLDG